MPTQVREIDDLQSYLVGVMSRADHHANTVNEIALAIAGAIVWKKSSSSIKVKSYRGTTKNVLWVDIGSNRYAFTYNHQQGTIDIREKTIRGDVIHSLSNSTSLKELKEIFERL